MRQRIARLRPSGGIAGAWSCIGTDDDLAVRQV